MAGERHRRRPSSQACSWLLGMSRGSHHYVHVQHRMSEQDTSKSGSVGLSHSTASVIPSKARDQLKEVIRSLDEKYLGGFLKRESSTPDGYGYGC